MTRFFIRVYAILLRLYPPAFHVEFGEEMQTVFAQTLMVTGHGSRMTPFLRELRDLPGSLLRVYANNLLHGGNMSTQNEYISPSTKWQAFLGMLPFLAFGIASMIGKVDHLYPFRGHDIEMVVYGLSLVGLLIGWIRGFPLWSYSYLGWSLVFAWFWAFQALNDWYWLLGITALIALLWTRSLEPIKKLLRDIWNDWTRLSLAMFAFVGFVGLIYDENHHPQLLWFMFAATMAISAGAWLFLRSSSIRGRVIPIVGSFISAVIISGICWNTWDWHAYNDIPKPDEAWYATLGISIARITFWILILFWPALIALTHRITIRRTANQ